MTQLAFDFTVAEPDCCDRCGGLDSLVECVCYMAEAHFDACPAIIRTERVEKTKRVPVVFATPHLCQCDGPRAFLVVDRVRVRALRGSFTNEE